MEICSTKVLCCMQGIVLYRPSLQHSRLNEYSLLWTSKGMASDSDMERLAQDVFYPGVWLGVPRSDILKAKHNGSLCPASPSAVLEGWCVMREGWLLPVQTFLAFETWLVFAAD
jgi:hypothetical protein